MNDEIVELQTRISFQEGVIEELNQVVTQQQQQLDLLQRQMDKLGLQVANFYQLSPAGQVDEPPPPHY